MKPNVQFSFALDGSSFIFDIHLLSPEQRLELVEWFCGILYRHQARRPKAERKRFVVILEEAQTYLYQGSMRSKKTRYIRMLLSEGRNYNVRFGCITQFASMVDKDAMKFMRQRYVGWTDEPNDIDYVTNLVGGYKDKLKSLNSGQFLFKNGNKVTLVEIEPFMHSAKPRPLRIQSTRSTKRAETRKEPLSLSVLTQIAAFIFIVMAILYTSGVA